MLLIAACGITRLIHPIMLHSVLFCQRDVHHVSPEIRAIIPIRQAAGETDVLIVEGLPK